MKRRIVASFLAICSAFTLVSCKKTIADNSGNIYSDCGGGYLWVTTSGKGKDMVSTIHVRDNSWVGDVDKTCIGAYGTMEFEDGDQTYYLAKTKNGWEIA